MPWGFFMRIYKFLLFPPIIFKIQKIAESICIHNIETFIALFFIELFKVLRIKKRTKVYTSLFNTAFTNSCAFITRNNLLTELSLSKLNLNLQ